MLPRLAVAGALSVAGGILMVLTALEFPEEMSDFYWMGPVIAAAGLALLVYAVAKLKPRPPW